MAALTQRLRYLERIASFEVRPVVVVLDATHPPAEHEQVIQRARETHPRAQLVTITIRVKSPAPGSEEVAATQVVASSGGEPTT